MRSNYLLRFILRILPLISLLLFSFAEICNGSKFIVLAFISILPFLFNYLKTHTRSLEVHVFMFFVFIGSLLNLISTSNGIGGTILFITTFSIALFCLSNLKLAYYISTIVLIYNLLFISKKIFIDFVNPEFIYENLGLSRNYPGYLLVVWVCFHSFTKYITKAQVSIILPILSLVVSFFLEGRSSMAILLFICIISLYLRNNKSFIFFPIIAIVCICVYWNNIIELFELTRFATESLDSPRVIIWGAYLKSLDIVSLIFGLDTLGVPALANYGGNPHNAFLNFHYRMGLIGLMPLLYYVFKALKIYLTNNLYFAFFLLLSLIGRFCFDSNLNTPYDFIFYTIIFYPILFNRVNSGVIKNHNYNKGGLNKILSWI